MAFSRRQFLGASAALLLSSRLPAATGRKLVLATWPNYHSADNLQQFTRQTGIAVEQRIFGSNEEMLSHLLSGRSGFDIVVATNYAVNAYGRMSLLRPLHIEQFPQVDLNSQQSRFISEIRSDDHLFGLPKNWGTTGFVYDTRHLPASMSSWRAFWDLAQTVASKHTVVHDYQLTAIGNALKYFGYSFNSTKKTELAQAERLLLQVKPHLKAISSLAYDQMRDGAWLSMAWSGDGTLLARENPAITYVIAEEGGEIWADYYCITRESKDPGAAAELINFLLTPAHNAKEVQAHGFPPIDQRVLPLLPKALLSNPIIFPPESKLKHLEFGARDTLTHPRRADILARFKQA